MSQPIPVPHRLKLPDRQFSRLPLAQFAPHTKTDYELAAELSYQEVQAYAGYQAVQVSILNEALGDVTFAREVDQAGDRLYESVANSDIFQFDAVTVLDETHQPTGSYKIRGATNFLKLHEQEALKTGVVTASAGNHGQGVAKAAHDLGIAATIVVPEGTPAVKQDGIVKYGGTVIVHGDNYDEANQRAIEIQANAHGLYVPAYNHRQVMAGQATAVKRLLHLAPETTDIVLPVGGGGLLAGAARYCRVRHPQVKLWPVGVTEYSAVAASYSTSSVKQVRPTRFADGVAVQRLGDQTLPIIKRLAERPLIVEELALKQTVGRLSLAGHVVEGAGAVGLIGALAHHAKLGAHPATVATGGNIDPLVLGECRALASSNRLTSTQFFDRIYASCQRQRRT